MFWIGLSIGVAIGLAILFGLLIYIVRKVHRGARH